LLSEVNWRLFNSTQKICFLWDQNIFSLWNSSWY